MSNEAKELLSEVNKLIKSGKQPSKKVLELLDDITNDLKVKKQKTKEKAEAKHNKRILDSLESLTEAVKTNKAHPEENKARIIDAISKIKIKAPIVNVKQPDVKVNIPKTSSPTIVVPDEVTVRNPSWLPSLTPITDRLDNLTKAIKGFGVKFPTRAKDAVPVKLVHNGRFYRIMGGFSKAVNGLNAFADSNNATQAGLVDEDRHVQVDIKEMPNVTVGNLESRPITAFGDIRMAELTPIIQGSFEYTVSNTQLSKNVVANSGTVTQADGMAVVGTGTTTASTALFQTKRHGRYRAGLGGLMRFTSLFSTPVAGTEMYIGLTDKEGSSAAFLNGLAVGYDGTTFGFHRWQNDVKFSIDQADWDDPLDGTGASGMTLDNTKLNVWFINFQYLGAGAITLSVEDQATGKMVEAHKILYANLNVSPSTHNPNYHFIIWANNGETTSDVELKCASYAYFTEGKTAYFEVHQPQNATGEKQKTAVTTEVAILTIRNKATYASKVNFIDVILEAVGVSIEAGAANNLGKVRLVKNATLGGTPSWSGINATDSVIEIDTSGTTVTGGIELPSIPLAGKNDKELLNLLPYKIILGEEETLTLAGSSVASATIKGSLLWKELF